MAEIFFRMLPQAFLDHINEQSDWWDKAMELVHAQELDVAMRNGYLNFYRHGQSIAKIVWNSRSKKPSAVMHKKYLGENSDSYTSLDPQHFFLSEQMLDSVIKNAEGYGGAEKKGCHYIAANHTTCLVDMEIGLPGLTSRFDLVAALPSGNENHLTFFEAKHSKNTCLRARNEKPTVLAQLAKYKHDLQTQKEYILSGYRSAVNTAKTIKIRSGSLQALATLSPETIRLDVQPRLVVFMPESQPRPLEERWQRVLSENGVRLIYAEDAKNIPLR